MSELEQLLEGVEVEWKTLKDVYKFQYGKGNTIPTSGGAYTVYGSNGIVGTHSEFNSEDSPVIGHIGAYAGIVNWGKGKHFVTYNGVICKLINEQVHPKYAYYYLLQQDFNSMAKNSSQPFVSYKELNRVAIPIPPLSVQKEIVRILDTFTDLKGELQTELIARKKQFTHYRDQLLSFEGQDVEWKTLGEFAAYEQPTKYIVKSTNYNDDFLTPVLTAGQTFILGYTDELEGINKASESPVIIFDDFTTANKWVDFNFKVKSSAMKIISAKDESKALLKYIFFWLQTLPSELVESEHKRQWISNYAKKTFPLPSLSVQKEIVRILDKFDTLANSKTEGLPAEIKLRHKQYEYYRDLLLTFPNPKD